MPKQTGRLALFMSMLLFGMPVLQQGGIQLVLLATFDDAIYRNVAWSPVENLFAISTGIDTVNANEESEAPSQIELWRVEGRELIQSDLVLEVPRFAGTLKFSPDGRTLAAGSSTWVEHPEQPLSILQASVYRWDVETGEPLKPLHTERDSYWPWVVTHGLDFSPDGDLISLAYNVNSAGCYRYRWYANVWNNLSGEPLDTAFNRAISVDFNADGTLLALSYPNTSCMSRDWTVEVWDVANNEMRYSFELLDQPTGSAISGPVFSPDGTTMLVYGSKPEGSGSAIYVWDMANFEQTTYTLDLDRIYGLVYHPDGELLLTTNWDGGIYVLESSTFEEIATLPPVIPIPLTEMVFNADGSLLATVDQEGHVMIWQVVTG